MLNDKIKLLKNFAPVKGKRFGPDFDAKKRRSEELSITKKRLQIGQKLVFDLASIDIDELIRELVKASKRRPPRLLLTLNPEFVMACENSDSFNELVRSSDLIIPDGVGLIWALRLGDASSFGQRLIMGIRLVVSWRRAELVKERLTGVEVAERLVVEAARKGRTVYFLGAAPGVAPRALAVWQQRHPKLKGWAESGPVNFEKATLAELMAVAKRIEEKSPDYLFVALGMGRQERFIVDYLSMVKTRLAMGVGGTFDYWAGTAKRAPISWQRRGGEWFYRLLTQPWRLGRQRQLLKFVWLVLRG